MMVKSSSASSSVVSLVFVRTTMQTTARRRKAFSSYYAFGFSTITASSTNNIIINNNNNNNNNLSCSSSSWLISQQRLPYHHHHQHQHYNQALPQPHQSRCITSTSVRATASYNDSYNRNSTINNSTNKSEKLRVAIVGGGCAGLSTALHLSELVERGLISGPIDLYEGPSPRKRDIGVGIWSTALQPMRECPRQSHQLVYNEMTKTYGTYIGDVGYRTPDGQWLMRSHLPTSEEELLAGQSKKGMPALIFLREMDMIQSLQKAIHWEEHLGNVKVHRNYKNQQGGYVYRVEESSVQPYSTRLVLNDSGTLLSDRDYHLIVAADGTHSVLRQRYAGHDYVSRVLMGTSALPTPNMSFELKQQLQQQQQSQIKNDLSELSQQQNSVGLQDREYTVFRGNAKISAEEMRLYDPTNLLSFQTWGEGHSMRFATLPLRLPNNEERQVWFITIDDDNITAEPDPLKRRDMLLEQFRHWHDPVCRIVAATPPNEILMERAIAHKHNMGPVLQLNTVIQQITGNRPPNAGDGPCMVFHGDAYMTVDPILAQGFTCAMEGSYELRKALERALLAVDNGNNDPSSSSPSNNSNSSLNNLAFNPYRVQHALKLRHDRRMERLICLLRATELVQALGQPTAGKIFGGFFHTHILRPITRMVPNFIKQPLFDAVLKYSLGLGLFPKTTTTKTTRTKSEKPK